MIYLMTPLKLTFTLFIYYLQKCNCKSTLIVGKCFYAVVDVDGFFFCG